METDESLPRSSMKRQLGPQPSPSLGKIPPSVLTVMVDALPSLVAYVDRSERYVFMNLAHAEAFRIDREKGAGLTMRELIGEEYYRQFKPIYDRVYSGEKVHAEIQLCMPSGEFRSLAEDFIPDFDEGGNVVGFTGIVTDITESKKSEERLQRLVQDLESETALRERVTAAITHDLRTPLTTAKMSAEMMIRRADRPEECKRFAEKIVESVLRADRMISDLLDASLVKAGKRLALQIEECRLVELMRKTLEEMAVVHGDRFVLRSPDMVNGFWDPSALRRAVENLLSNAIKYGDPDREITLSIGTQTEIVEIAVHNFGEPLSERERDKLFRLFQRTQTGMTSGQRGWGIGTSLIRGIAEAHGGEVRAESLENGNRFTISIPWDARPFVAEPV